MLENSDREGSGTSEDALEDDDDEVNLELESLGLWNSQTQQQLFGADVDDIYNQPESPVESPAKRPRTVASLKNVSALFLFLILN